jgi:hypothetical protein
LVAETTILLVRDVLDEQLELDDHTPLGRVDGVVAELRANAPPRLVAIELGAVVLAARLPWLGDRVARLVRRLGAAPAFRISWSRIRKTELNIVVDVDAESTPGMVVERWLRDHIIERIPGS